MTHITGATKLYALIGDPVEHSLSPLIHNTAFQHLGFNYVYLCLQVKSIALEKAVEGIKSLGILGFNVTIPHKISIMKYLDEIDTLAKNIGAVNTVANKNGKLVGYNTDGLGALAALIEENVNLNEKKVVVLGAGGASKALSFCITPIAKCLVILNRTNEKTVKLASILQRRFKKKVIGRKLSLNALSEELADADVLINATSVGMYPKTGESLVDQSLLHSRMIVFDIVYNPRETRLLKEAKKAGAKTVGGLSMLVHQGALSFKIWTGVKPPTSVIFRAVEEALESE